MADRAFGRLSPPLRAPQEPGSEGLDQDAPPHPEGGAARLGRETAGAGPQPGRVRYPRPPGGTGGPYTAGPRRRPPGDQGQYDVPPVSHGGARSGGPASRGQEEPTLPDGRGPALAGGGAAR